MRFVRFVFFCVVVSLCVTVYYASKDENTRRFAGAAKVVDIFEMSAADAADAVNVMCVHVLVDMSGYTTDHRQQLFIARPAPLQVRGGGA